MEIGAQTKARFADALNQSFNLTAVALKKDPHDVYALYALGVAHGLRANYLFLVEKAWMDSLKEITAARKTNQRILEIDPSFIDARSCWVSTNTLWDPCRSICARLAPMGGFHGDKEGGIRQLELVAGLGPSIATMPKCCWPRFIGRESAAATSVSVPRRNWPIDFHGIIYFGLSKSKCTAISVIRIRPCKCSPNRRSARQRRAWLRHPVS